MRLLKMPAQAKVMPHDLCTLEHLDDRYSPERGKHFGEIRVVAACWLCNHEQNKKREKEVGLEVLWQKSNSYPNDFFS